MSPWTWTVRELMRVAGTIGIGQQRRYQRHYTQSLPASQ